MVSRHQSGGKSDWEAVVEPGDSDTFRDAVKMLATKNDATISGLIRGIRKPERARAYIEAEVRLADYEGRDARKPLIGMVNSKQDELKESDTEE